MLFSYPEVLYRSFGSSITFGLDETCWQRISAKVASHVFSLLASVEGTTVCFELPLQSPPPPGRPSLGDRVPPPTGRPSHANPGVCKGGGYVCMFVCMYVFFNLLRQFLLDPPCRPGATGGTVELRLGRQPGLQRAMPPAAGAHSPCSPSPSLLHVWRSTFSSLRLHDPQNAQSDTHTTNKMPVAEFVLA